MCSRASYAVLRFFTPDSACEVLRFWVIVCSETKNIPPPFFSLLPMSYTFEQSKDEIARLVKHFTTNRAGYLSPFYKEAHARQEFIDPLFVALNWDVHNSQHAAPDYREVIVEDTLDIEGHAKAPDYAFRMGRERKFFTEAKKPGVDLKSAAAPAYQLRRYAWSAKLALSLLTDFEELAVYDCRIRPAASDKTTVARVNYLRYDEYPDRWQEIWDVFSREAVWGGSFDQYAQTSKGKRGASEVDAEFLKEIEGWREVLAKNIALRNPRLTIDELNDAVQRTIDRIIFLRMAEDRGIEDYGRLQRLAKGTDIYAGLLALSRQADAKYNSGLFDFSKAGDRVTPGLAVDDRTLKPILADLYYPQSPYEFSVLPVEILGNVYEQFLGKVIRLTAAHQAKVEEKPEVKKAGGVFYTPAYIVNYIVKNTVGKQIEGKSPRQLKGFRVLDMACGSGSFLLGAYQYLLDYYQQWYAGHDPEKHSGAMAQQGDAWRLLTAEKKRILTEHIFGVDIDRQAVEVTKLSLLLKVLEGESDETLGKQLSLWQERALPNLDRNIKCGNSLIGSDYFAGQFLPDTDELRRVNPFDWAAEFPEAMQAGGFDCVIGNPPYVDIKSLPSQDVRYIFSVFPSANNRINLFAAFIEKSLMVAKRRSFGLSMIIPTALLTQESYRTLRKTILDNCHISSIVRLPNESFGSSAGDVKVDTVIVVLTDETSASSLTEIISYMGYDRISRIDPSTAHVHNFIHQSTWKVPDEYVWLIATSGVDNSILTKCELGSVPLEECAEFCLGLTPYDKYKGHTSAQIKNKVFHANHQKDKTFRMLLAGNDVRRYYIEWNGEQWISYGSWLGAPREKRFFTQRRILVKQIIDWTNKRIWASITDEELYNAQNAFNLLAKEGWRLEYLLGVLNSSLMTFYHRKKYLDEFKMRFQKILIKDCRRFPIHMVNYDEPTDKAQHDKMVTLVEQMLELHKRKAGTQDAAGKERLQRLIDSTDKQIDALVYELYGLSAEEIAVVENAR